MDWLPIMALFLVKTERFVSAEILIGLFFHAIK